MKRTLRQRIGAGIAGVGLVSMAIGVLSVPSMADPLENGSCNGINGNPQGTLAIGTVPPAGTESSPADISAGATVVVTATWETEDWTGLDQLSDCVELDGVLAEGLSDTEKPPENDGRYVHRFTVPAGTDPGTLVCVRARLSGQPADPPGDEDPVTTEKSNSACFRVQAATAPDTTEEPTTTTTTSQTVTTTAAPTTTTTAAPTATTTAPAAPVAGSNVSNTPGPSVLGSQVVSGNAEALGSQVAALDTLPRTGTSAPVLLVLAGLALLLGGAAVGFGKPYSLN